MASDPNGKIDKQYEKDFHDDWAKSEDIAHIDVIGSNEALTAPEMRFISTVLGEDLTNTSLLDVGSGLGEAGVYFATKGAKVTLTDLSPEMLRLGRELGERYGVKVKTHLADASSLRLNKTDKFDVIYLGNLLHHVEIEDAIVNAKKHLKQDGMFVSWDPLAYNPVINIYRKLATDVRTPDEHPLTRKDLMLFEKHFEHVEQRFFWLTSLIIFVLMFVIERRNPNKERFWKVILKEGNKWAWLFKPLSILDRCIITIFPPIRLLCWNVVVVARGPK